MASEVSRYSPGSRALSCQNGQVKFSTGSYRSWMVAPGQAVILLRFPLFAGISVNNKRIHRSAAPLSSRGFGRAAVYGRERKSCPDHFQMAMRVLSRSPYQGGGGHPPVTDTIQGVLKSKPGRAYRGMAAFACSSLQLVVAEQYRLRNCGPVELRISESKERSSVTEFPNHPGGAR